MTFRAPLRFYFDFVVFPLVALIVFAGWCRDDFFIGLAIFGIILFTFVEYWVHRVALHRYFYHGNHEHHHEHPADYVQFPIYFTPIIFFVFWLLLPLPVFSGMLIGYCWFLYWHHILHHFDLSNWPRPVRRYALWHLAHHHDETCNFGITAPWADWLFGTYRKTGE